MTYPKGTVLKHVDGSTSVADGSTDYDTSKWSVVSGVGGITTPPVTTPPSQQPQGQNAPIGQTYVVKAGDTLSKIAQQYGVDYKTITGYRSGNPNLIYPGEVLNIPGVAGGAGGTTLQPPVKPTPYQKGISARQEVTKQGVYSIDQNGNRTFLRALQLGDVMGQERYTEQGWTPMSSEELAGKGTAQVMAQFTDVIIPPYNATTGAGTLSSLAQQYGTTVEAIMAANVGNPAIKSRDMIMAGQTIKIPVGKATGTANVPGQQTSELPSADQFAGLNDVQKLQTIKDLAAAGVDWADIAKYFEAMATPEKTTKELQDEIYAKYGIPDIEAKMTDRPTQTFEELYKAAADAGGVTTYKSQMDSLQAQITKADADFATATGNVNENPWISEAGRVGKNRRVTEEYNKTKTLLQNQLIVATNNYDRAKQDAENIATRAINQFDKERQWNREDLAYLIDRADADLKAQTKLQATQQERELLKYFPEYAKSAAEAKKKATTESFKGITGASLSSRIEQEITNALQGQYGTEGAREKIVNALNQEFPGQKATISKMVYSRLPDGWESNLKTTRERDPIDQAIYCASNPDDPECLTFL